MNDEGGVIFTDAKRNANEYAGTWTDIGQADVGKHIHCVFSRPN